MENKKKEMAIDADKLIVRVHNKIALWNNSDDSTEVKAKMLKILAHDIVTDIITESFSQLNGAKVKEQIILTPKRKGFFDRFKSKKH